MAIQVEHDIHHRRRSRNVGLGVVLVGLIAVVFGLTVVKVQQIGANQGFDHVVRPELLPGEELPQ